MVEGEQSDQKQIIQLEGELLKIKVGDKVECVCKGDNPDPVLREFCGAVFQVVGAGDDYITAEITEKLSIGPGCKVGDIITIENKYLTDAYFEKK